MTEREQVNADQITQIEARVGFTPAARLQWALNFGQRDLNTLTEGDWTNLRRELVAFDVRSIPFDQARTRRFVQNMKSWANPETFPLTPVELPSRDEVHKVQKEFLRIIDSLIKTGQAEVGPITSDLHVLRDTKRQRGWCVQVRRVDFGTSRQGFPMLLNVTERLGQSVLAHLLGAFALLVRECPEPKCHRWFVAGRRNQQYCSTRCQTRASTRAYRKALAQKKRRSTRRRRKAGKGGP
jgi:predicted RNA-binding Zn ribbon-like protein